MAFNARKTLARLEVRSLTLADLRPRSALVGTSKDATAHAPPQTKAWRRIERAIAMLRQSVWGGASRIHSSQPPRMVADPNATANIDVAGALGMASRRNDGRSSRASSGRALALAVYLYRNWPAYAERNHAKLCVWAHRYILSMVAPKSAQSEKPERLFNLAEFALKEFAKPAHCAACGGYGRETTGVRVGQACVKCVGIGLVELSANARARALRIRRADWERLWSPLYLRLYDRLVELEGIGARLHAQAMDG